MCEIVADVKRFAFSGRLDSLPELSPWTRLHGRACAHTRGNGKSSSEFPSVDNHRTPSGISHIPPADVNKVHLRATARSIFHNQNCDLIINYERRLTVRLQFWTFDLNCRCASGAVFHLQ